MCNVQIMKDALTFFAFKCILNSIFRSKRQLWQKPLRKLAESNQYWLIMSFSCTLNDLSLSLCMCICVCTYTCMCAGNWSREFECWMPWQRGGFYSLTTKPHGQRRRISNSLKPPMFQHKHHTPQQQRELCTLCGARKLSCLTWGNTWGKKMKEGL